MYLQFTFYILPKHYNNYIIIYDILLWILMIIVITLGKKTTCEFGISQIYSVLNKMFSTFLVTLKKY